MSPKALPSATNNEVDPNGDDQKAFIEKVIEVIGIALSFLLGRLFKKWF